MLTYYETFKADLAAALHKADAAQRARVRHPSWASTRELETALTELQTRINTWFAPTAAAAAKLNDLAAEVARQHREPARLLFSIELASNATVLQVRAVGYDDR